MTPQQYLKNRTTAEVEATCEKAGTNLANFKQIALWKGACSPDLARRLAQASGGAMTLEDILFRHERDSDDTAA